MPPAWRVHVLEQRLASEGIPAEVTEADLYLLLGSAREVLRDALLDAMGRGDAEPPMVLVGDTIACAGEIDLDAVVRIARDLKEAAR